MDECYGNFNEVFKVKQLALMLAYFILHETISLQQGLGINCYFIWFSIIFITAKF